MIIIHIYFASFTSQQDLSYILAYGVEQENNKDENLFFN